MYNELNNILTHGHSGNTIQYTLFDNKASQSEDITHLIHTTKICK